MSLGLLRFEEQYMPRIWGGRQLASVFGKPLPPEGQFGEAWLISDHSNHESVVASGVHAGKTLHQLLIESPDQLLGANAKPTVHGRFPLLLKILDAREVLSVQVHPDDETAAQLGEPDVGKTEMWHVLQAEPGSELICGLRPNMTAETFSEAAASGVVQADMIRFPATPGQSVFVPAGAVHAIGEGILIAEIQQNSDLTYRIYDWDRIQADGSQRDLHLDKSAAAIHFGSAHSGPAVPLCYDQGGTQVDILAACRYFAAERITTRDHYTRQTRQDSFHIVLCIKGELGLAVGDDWQTLSPGSSVIIPGEISSYTVVGDGEFLNYYVPDVVIDIREPLLQAGHHSDSIIRLGGHPAASDLAS